MNKAQLVAAVADRVGDSKAATDAVNAVLGAIQDTVAGGDKVSITGFGVFEEVYKPARTARVPSTGDPVKVEESWAPRFRPGAEFKAAVNAGGRARMDAGA